jgi:iron complex outermembrane receptor protein
MDIRFVDTDFGNLNYQTTVANILLTGLLGFSDVDHEMTNFELRDVPAGPMRHRLTRAGARTFTAALGAATEVGSGELRFGVDSSNADLEARITNPNDADFFLDNLPGIEVDRYGFYADWSQPLGTWEMSIGTRVDRHDAVSDPAVTGTSVQMMPRMLAMMFNQSDRHWRGTTTDVVARFWTLTNNLTWRASIARKNRVPSYVERFAWLPTAASAGLADGNNYVGDLELDEETAWIIEAGVDFNGNRWWVKPTLYYHRVDDFIQGVPFDSTPGVVDTPVEMVSSMNGDPTPLRFANVDAEMYGIDADYGVQLNDSWHLEGVLSVVRGKRRDLGDNLYRIAPDRLSLGVVYAQPQWRVSLESVMVNKQHKVSASNSEQRTAGHAILNLYAHWQPSHGLLISMGLENVLDQYYRNHMGGYNRIGNSDVQVGERLPGTGRNVYFRVQLKH